MRKRIIPIFLVLLIVFSVLGDRQNEPPSSVEEEEISVKEEGIQVEEEEISSEGRGDSPNNTILPNAPKALVSPPVQGQSLKVESFPATSFIVDMNDFMATYPSTLNNTENDLFETLVQDCVDDRYDQGYFRYQYDYGGGAINNTRPKILYAGSDGYYNESLEVDGYFKLYAAYPGTLRVRAFGNIEYYVTGVGSINYFIQNEQYNEYFNISFDVTKDHINLNKELFFRVIIQGFLYNDLPTNWKVVGYVSVQVFNQDTETWDDQTESGEEVNFLTNTWYNNVERKTGKVTIDQIKYTPDIVKYHIRTQRQRTAVGSYVHSFNIGNIGLSYPEHKIYVPMGMDFGSVVPYAVTGFDSSHNLWINETVATVYNVILTETTAKQYLAIDDKSSDYFSDIGFEGSWSNDWEEKSGYEWGSMGLNSTIVYEGAFSWRLSETSSSRNILFAGSVGAGYYYVHFAYYYESIITGSINLYVYDGSSWQTVYTDTTTNRWHNLFGFVHSDGNVETFRIDTTANFEGVVFVDDFEIWQVNHVQETVGYRQLKVGGQIISWDGYDNPAVPSETIQLELRDRTADSSIVSTSKTTDSSGNFEWEIDTSSYSELKDQREIEFRSYSWNSWWGTPWTKTDLWDLSNWNGVVESSTTEYVQIETDGSSVYQVKFMDGGSTWDLTEIDYFYLDSSLNYTLLYYQFVDSGNDWIRGDIAVSSDVFITVQVALDTSDFPDSSGTFDYDAVDDYDGMWADSPLKHRFKDIHIIQSQKSYFTPILATDYQYFYETDPQNNEFDFSEETVENWVEITPNTETISSVDGSVQWKSAGISTYCGIQITGLSIDASEYNRAVLRIKSNNSDGSKIKFRNYDYSVEYGSASYYSLAAGSYQIFIIEFSANWVGTITGLSILLYDSDWSALEGDEYYWLDEIRIIKRDTPSLSVADSYAWASSSNNSFDYRIENNGSIQGYYSDLQEIGKNQSVGSHNLTAIPFNDKDRSLVFLPGSSLTTTYSVTVDDISSVSLVDQSNNFLEPRSFKIYVDGSRIYGDSFLWVDTSATKNITITDMFDNQLFQNTAYSYSRFVDVVLTLYSVKVMNMQENPVHIRINRSNKQVSEWIFTYEIVKFHLESDSYTFQFNFSTINSNYRVAQNTSYITFTYSVTTDTAIMVTGNTIKDIFDNILDLSSDLANVNSTLFTQVLNVNISLSNQNSYIQDQIVNVDILVTNTNTSLFNQVLSVETDIANLDTDMMAQFVQVIADIASSNSTIYQSVIDVLTNVTQINNSIIAQVLTLYTAITLIEPADPYVEVLPTPVTVDDEDFVNKLQQQDKDITFLGSLLSVSVILIIFLIVLSLFKPERYSEFKKWAKQEGIRLSSSIEKTKGEYFEL